MRSKPVPGRAGGRRRERRRVARRLTAAALAASVCPGAGIGAATVEAVSTNRWVGGQFVRAGVPIYGEPVDGWGCHLFFHCRDGMPAPETGPIPIADSHVYEHVDVECRLGNHYKIHADHGIGWAPTREIDIVSGYRPDACTALDF